MDPYTTDPSKLFSVEGMVVVITGGGTGIGLMMTKAFAHNGASKVYIIGRRKEKLSAAVLEAGSRGNVIPIVGDVTNPQSLQSISSQIQSEAGFINLLICNSGVYSPSIANPAQVPISEFVQKAFSQGPEVWNDSFATNSTSVAFTAFAFLPLLHAGNLRGNCAGRQSQILVTSSIAGYLRNPQAVGAYPVTKAATTHLVKGLAGALVPYSIRVNALAPGLFPSDLAAELIAKGGTPLKEDPCVEGAFAKSFIPAQRVGSPADMAGTVLYLASAAGAYVNGNIQVIDGGRIAIMHGTY
ncbi:NAD(P)-binding protein [Sphaerulina musiva SO2202]|uniref:NAD(P)-binding protein n=1 Tax=Sphaerulina musiva (strain SO2202) TaxID=692275 RepID=N1QJL9_SPHMS|nr:NAD(P)-binding protein [Sphaerulina musiva SO2202]EMF12000.1 NAD(P)-binding protein [Sphaerulina musiva SO2202]